jgi:hypothetical protein
MGFRCGMVGLPGCGKTTIYNAITAAGAAGFGAEEAHRAVVNVPDERIQPLVDLYDSAKTVPATVEVVDIPGLKAGSAAGEGRGSKLLGHIKDVDALLHVVRCFDDPIIPYEEETAAPARDVETIDLELMIADARTLGNKIERLAKRARTGDADAKRELADCEAVKAALEEGVPARRQDLSEQALGSIYECNLASLKPVLYVGNIKEAADRENAYVAALRAIAEEEGAEMILVHGRDEAEISELPEEDREVFLQELGLESTSAERLIRAGYRLLGLVNFFTAGPKEVHVWTVAEGTHAPQAAGRIHSDMEQGFIRMEVIRYEDLMEHGSEAAVAKAGRQRIEGKDYVVRDGDIVVVRFNK